MSCSLEPPPLSPLPTPATSFPPPSILIGPNVCVNKVCAVQIAFCCTIKQGPGHGNLLINHHVIHGYGSVSLCLATGLSLRLSQTSHPRASPSSQLPAHPRQQPVPTHTKKKQQKKKPTPPSLLTRSVGTFSSTRKQETCDTRHACQSSRR